MSQLGPPSAMGGAAPLNAPPSEQTLSIRVACEGTDCNALLEVPIPDNVRSACPPSLVIKCAQCKRMLKVNLPAETYATYNAQLQAQQQAALIRQRQQELATLQALQMQLQAQQQALLSNFPGNNPPMGNFGGQIPGFSGPVYSQGHLQQQQQQQFSGGGGGGGGQNMNFSMSPASLAALGIMNFNNNMPSGGSYSQSLHQVPSNSSLPHMLPPPPQQQQYSQQNLGPQSNYGQQQQYQPHSQQQQHMQTHPLPIMPLSTPAQMPSMPSAAAIMAEHQQQQQQRQQQQQNQQQQYQNQLLQQHNQQQYHNTQFNVPASPGNNNAVGATGAGGGGVGNDITSGTIYHQGNIQGGPHGGAGSTQTAHERPATAGTAASPTVDGDGDGGGGIVGNKRSKSSPPLPDGEEKEKKLNVYQTYMGEEYKRLRAENPGMSSKDIFAKAAQKVSNSEGKEEEEEEEEKVQEEEPAAAAVQEIQQKVQEAEEEQDTGKKKVEGEEYDAGKKNSNDNEGMPPPPPPPATAAPLATPTSPTSPSAAVAAAAAEIEARQRNQQHQQAVSLPSAAIGQTNVKKVVQRSFSDVLRMQLAGALEGGGDDGDGGEAEGQFSKKDVAAAGKEEEEEKEPTQPTSIVDRDSEAQVVEESKEGFREEER